ncbi:type II toxin-antitoxin system VapC family toxin [Candidatus Methylospira mobilis]|uniref:type II toxin-antitoxin system VapC family toxin n=1 Tax=Candidatus Methylospira mobilis TaxID=1808979 RepID=UPI0028EA09E5|nr:type II toxin-antitoxin system VapC family toxin [Candidatus Methylospira mobilis]WNV04916.1 type II toxin-antitoxin system VapC family toxin [Candidatus Methylospira mobilis]
MMLMDVNVLVYAHREDAKDHRAYRDWLESAVNSNMAFGFSELVLSGFIRVVTHPKVFESPSPPETAIAFAQQLRSAEYAVCLSPGRNHWDLFLQCARSIAAQGNDIPDAYHAALALALAMEWDCDWITTDKGFRRFKGLRIRHPLKK